MSTETANTGLSGITDGNWQAGTVGGILGAVVMGVIMTVLNEAALMVAIPSLYGLAPPPNPVAGWVFHISHGAVLGVVFAAIAGAADLDSIGTLVGAGFGWGVVTWVVTGSLLLPLWLGAVGSPAAAAVPFPTFAVPSLVWHVAYGLVLGAVYAPVGDYL